MTLAEMLAVLSERAGRRVRSDEFDSLRAIIAEVRRGMP